MWSPGSFCHCHRRAVEARLPVVRGSVGAVRPGLLGFVGIPLSRSVETFLFGGTPRFEARLLIVGVFGWRIWLMMLGLVARRLRPGSAGDGDPPGVVRPAEAGGCWDFT